MKKISDIFGTPIVKVLEDDETEQTEALVDVMMGQISEQMIAGLKIKRTILAEDPYSSDRTLALHLSDGSLFTIKGQFKCERQMPS